MTLIGRRGIQDFSDCSGFNWFRRFSSGLKETLAITSRGTLLVFRGGSPLGNNCFGVRETDRGWWEG